MNLRRVASAATWLILLQILLPGGAHGQSTIQTILEARKPNFTDPQYIRRDDVRQSHTLVLFIHGIFGDTVDTWKGSSGLSLPLAALGKPEFAVGYDAYAFGFPSSMVKQGSFTVTQAAAALKRTWDFEEFAKYKDVVLVAHSMGGLVALESLTTFSDMRSKVRLVVTYSTPYNGAQVSTIARKVIKNDALSDMFPADSANSFISSLTARWKQYQVSEKAPIMVKCAYETVPFPGVGLIVAKTSGEALCNGGSDPIAEDHIGITKPTTVNHDSIKVLVNALRETKARTTTSTSSPTTKADPVQIEELLTASLAPDAVFVADKVHRNLAELLGDAGHRVVAPPTSVADKASSYSRIFSLDLKTITDRLTIGLRLKSGDGTFIASTEISGRTVELQELYKVIPAALMYGLDIDEVSLKRKDSARKPTNNTFAYALYLYSWRQLESADKDGAERSLLRSVQADGRFAMGYWALSELKRRAGAAAAANAYAQKAKAIDPDHSQIPGASAPLQDNPISAVKTSIRDSYWRKLPSGLQHLHARNSAYGVEVRAWKFSVNEFKVSVVEQKSPLGSSVSDHIVDGDALLVVSGGFFNKDQDSRLSPAGILVTAGVIRNRQRNKQSGALVVDRRHNVRIDWTKDLDDLSNYIHVLQSGPLLVEGPGKMGIRKDDFDRLNRTAVCLAGSDAIIVDVHGQQNKGLSLFQFATLLMDRVEDGGLGCLQALNLDGGPSSQAAFRDGDKVSYIPGLWKNQNAIVVSRR